MWRVHNEAWISYTMWLNLWIFFQNSVLFWILVMLYKEIRKSQEILGNQNSVNVWILSESIKIQNAILPIGCVYVDIVISVIKPESARPSILCFLTLIYFVPEVGVCPPRLSYLFWKCNKQWGLNPGDLKERYKLHMSFDIKQLCIATAVNKSQELN